MPCNHLKVLELIHKGKLEESHKLVMSYSDELSCLIHAYIHRAEGDLNNANYWYRRAGVDQPNCSLEEELDEIHKSLSNPN